MDPVTRYTLVDTRYHPSYSNEGQSYADAFPEHSARLFDTRNHFSRFAYSTNVLFSLVIKNYFFSFYDINKFNHCEKRK